MKKIVRSLFILSLITFSIQTTPVYAQNPEWRVTVFLSGQYVYNQLDTNAPFELSDLDNEWLILTGHSFSVNLNKRVLKIKLRDLGYVDVDRKGILGPALGVNKSVNLEVKLHSWHTVYVIELAKNGKHYETLYGLVSDDNGQTYQYKVIIPRREQK